MFGDHSAIEANVNMETIDVHDHVAFFHRDNDELFRTLVKLIHSGHARGEMSIFLSWDNDEFELVKGLRAAGVRKDVVENAGDFRYISVRKNTQSPIPNVEDILSLIESEIDSALDLRYPAARVFIDLEGLRTIWTEEMMVQLSSLRNEIFEEKNALGISLHTLDPSDSSYITGMLASHPVLIYRGFVCHNYFYIPPTELNKRRSCHYDGIFILDRSLEVQMNEISIVGNDDRLEIINSRLREEIKTRQMVEWALVESENNYRMAINAMSDMVAIVEKSGRVILANDMMMEKAGMIGLGNVVVGMNIFDNPTSMMWDIGNDIQMVLKKGNPAFIKKEFRVNGTTRTVDLRMVPIFNGEHTKNVMIIIRDVTDHPKMDEFGSSTINQMEMASSESNDHHKVI